MVTIGTGKIGFGPACAAAGATSAIDAALAAAAIASSSRRVGEIFFMFCAPFSVPWAASCAPDRLIIDIPCAGNAGRARRGIVLSMGASYLLPWPARAADLMKAILRT
jgi:hypothetical protein